MVNESQDQASPQAAALRAAAEAAVRGNAARLPDDLEARSPADLRAMLHELRVYQTELELQNEELRRAQVDLDAVRERYFDLYELAPVGYVTVGESGLIQEANLTAATLLGVARGTLVRQPLSRFIRQEDQDVYYLCRQRLAASGQRQVCDLRMVKADGTECWVRLETTVAQDAQGTPVNRVVLSDITDRKQVEASLRLKNFVFDASIAANSIADMDGVITEANAAFLRIWGYSAKEEVVGKPILHFLEDPNEAASILAALDRTGHWEGSYTARRGDSSSFIGDAIATVVRDETGQIIGYQSSVIDVTNRREIEQSLSRSEEKYRKLHESMMDAFVSVDMTGHIIECNSVYQEMLGYTLAELRGLTYAEITPAAWHALEARLVADQILPRGFSDLYEKEYRRKDGTVFPVELRTFLLRDAADQPVAMCAIVRDITARKRSQQALQRSESLLNAIQHLSKVGGWLWDVERQRMFWTEETYRIHEYTPGEVGTSMEEHIAKSLGCCDEADRPGIMAVFRRCVEHGEPYDIEYPFTTAVTGRRLWLRTTAHAEWDGPRIVKVVGNIMDITERKRAEELLRDSNELLTLFMRCSPIYSFIKAVTPTESRVLYASENYQQMIGIPGSEMMGKTMAELFPADLAAKFLTDDFAVVATGELLAVDEDFDGRNYHTIKFPIVLGGSTLLGGYTMDVTERRQAEQALQDWNQTLEQRVAERTLELSQSEARFRQLADATDEGIAITVGGKVRDGNTRYAEIHGYELAEMIGRPIEEFVAPESQAKVAEQLRDGSEATYEITGRRRDGSTFPAKVHGRMGIWMGRETRISVLSDLTAIKRAEAGMLALRAELEQAQRLALVSEISAGIIHQICQPLCAIGANLTSVTSRLKACGLPSCGSLPVVKAIEADVDRMREIVTHMRALAGRWQPSREGINLNDIVVGILPLLREKAESRRVQIVVELAQDLPMVHVDAVQMSQVILNLVRNAFEACAESPPERRVVAITTRVVADEGVELGVRDAGAGIAPEIQTRLFTPFFSTKPDGFGIGLRLSRTIVETHGGRIAGFNNADGVGATFRVVLPAVDPKQRATPS